MCDDTHSGARAFEPMIQFGLPFRTIKTNLKLNILKTSRISITSYNTNIFSISSESAFAAFVRRPGGERKAEVKLTPMPHSSEYHSSNPVHI